MPKGEVELRYTVTAQICSVYSFVPEPCKDVMSNNRSTLPQTRPQNRPQKQNAGEEFEVILTHEHADFDAIASLLAASLLYPQALPVYPYWVNRNVRNFLDEHQHLISFVRARDLPRGRVTRAILVDTLRVNQVKGMNDSTAYFAIDHHTRTIAPPDEWKLWSEPVGANVTLLIEDLIGQQIQLTSVQATLMAMAIHEDTGSLTYAATTTRDAACLAWLLEQGADLEIILRYTNHPLDQAQRDLLDTLVQQCEFIERKGYAIAIAQATIGDFRGEFSTLIARLRDNYDLDAAFLLIERGDVVHMVARSTKAAFDVGVIARELGGDGHPRASAAPVRNRSIQSVRDQLVALLEQQLKAQEADGTPPKPASDLAARDATQPRHEFKQLEQVLPLAQLRLLRLLGEVAEELGHKIYVVGGFVRDLFAERTLLHDSMHERVSNFDLDIVIESAGANGDAPAANDLGLVPPDNAINFAEEIVGRFGGRFVPHKRFGTAKWFLNDPDNPVDIDALCGTGLFGATTASRSMVDASSAKVEEAATASDDNQRLPPHLDFVSARTEFYNAPTELPTVAIGNIELDLKRRDFTVNTMALALTPTHWGELLDYFGGMSDLQQGTVRVLHSRSFVDDPTRMVRAVRYEQRFGFQIDAQTEALLIAARSLLQRLSPARLWAELDRIFHERLPEGALSRLQELGLLEMIHPALEVTMQVRNDFVRLREALAGGAQKARVAVIDGLLRATPIERLYWGLLIYPLAAEVDEALTERLTLRGETQQLMRGIRTLQGAVDQLANQELSISRMVAILDRVDPVALALVYVTSARRPLVHTIERYLVEWRHVAPLLNGHDLEELGVARGPFFREILETLRMNRLDGAIDSKEDEMRYVEQWLANK